MIRTLASLLLFAAFAHAEDKPQGENPYRDCKLGDWIEAKGPNGLAIKHTVTVKTKDEVRIRIEQKVPGAKSEPIEFVVDLNAPYPPPSKVKVDYTSKQEKLDSGKETLTIGDKKYDCEWDKVRHTIVIKFDDKETTQVTTAKVWRCKDVPLQWPVRSETETGDGQVSVMELTGYGRGQ